MSGHIRFNENTDDEFEPSDSDDELTEKDRSLLKKARKKKQTNSDSEDEVYGVHSDSAESDLALSDVEGQGEDDDLPDARAWGKDKRNYYSTDYVDPDYGGFQGRDATLAEIEEQEARTLQKQLAEQLDDDDFSLGILSKDNKEEDKKIDEEIIKTDLAELSKRQKIHLLQKESPEIFGLIEDYEVKITLVHDFLFPIIKLNEQNKVSNCKAIDFCKTYNELIMNYCTNIYMYLLLKANRVKMQTHPVIKRLCQYRHLMGQMQPVFEEIIKPQIEVLISEHDHTEVTEAIQTNKRKTLKLLSKLIQKQAATNVQNKKKAADFDTDVMPPMKKHKSILKNGKDGINGKSVTFPDNNCGLAENSDTDEDGAVENMEEEKQGDGETEKRGITYQIKKNKGLTPHRKKELRNPRVKHRNKFRKANIRRKGAVRGVRTEKERYGGEMSGIKASVTKSIKIKT